MRISAKCDYTCRALLELSMHWPKKEPLQIQSIVANQSIPMRYLVQILIQLKQMGLVTSVRGKLGGYHLKKPPGKIYLGKVIREIGGPLLPVASGTSAHERNGVFMSIWDEVEKAMSGIVDRITFAEICDKARAVDKVLTYQI